MLLTCPAIAFPVLDVLLNLFKRMRYRLSGTGLLLLIAVGINVVGAGASTVQYLNRMGEFVLEIVSFDERL